MERSVKAAKQKRSTVTRALRHLESTCAHCHAYICAFTSNYPGRGNPVRRRTAPTREDQRTRYSELLHSSPSYNAASRATVGGGGIIRHRRSKETWRNFGKQMHTSASFLAGADTRSFEQLPFLFPLLNFSLKKGG